MVTELLGWGFTEERILDFDLPSFFSACESVSRVQARNKIETAWGAMIAAQGSGEGMKKFLESYHEVLESSGQAQKNDTAAFAMAIGKK